MSQTIEQTVTAPRRATEPRLISAGSWDEVQALAQEWIRAGAARQAFRLVLAYRLANPAPESARFLRESFRDEPFRFALVMVQGIGNMVMLTPTIRALKEVYPRAEIEVVGHMPALEVVRDWALVNSVTDAEQYDPSAERDALLLTMWSGAFQKAHAAHVTSGDVPAVRMKQTWGHVHEAESHLGLARSLGYESEMPAPHCCACETQWPFQEDAPVALLSDTSHPDQEWQRKRWPHWPALAARLLDRGYQVALVGGPQEAEAFDPAAWPRGVVNLCGRYTIPETAHLLARAGLLIANDSGPAHVAGAVGAETYVLFGATLERKNSPLGPRVHVLTSDVGCRPCQYLPSWERCTQYRCMELITVEQVMDAVFGQPSPQAEPAASAVPTPPAAPAVCVDLGCGRWKRKGHIGIDVDPETGADIVCDVTQGIPLADNSVDRLVADNLLEHIGDGFVTVMNEIWRVCKPGAEVEVVVPVFPSDKAVADPTHRRYFTEQTFAYLNGEDPTWHMFGASYGFKPFRVLAMHTMVGELEAVLTPDKTTEAPRPPHAPAGRPRRICMISHNPPGAGGAEKVMHKVANRLAARGYKVIAFYNAKPFGHDRPVEHPADAQYDLRWVEGPSVPELHAAAAEAAGRCAGETDIYLPLWRATSPELIEACRAAGVPVGIWCHNVHYAPERGNRSIFRLADFVVAVTPVVRLLIGQRFGRTQDVYVIPNAADDAFFDAYCDRTGRAIERFVFFGRLEDGQKGLVTLCEALGLLRDQGLEFTMDFIGSGPDGDLVRSAAGALGLGERIHLRGWMAAEELAQRLRDYDLCILPSNYEACSLAVIEAMAAGIPLIATAVGGTPQLVVSHKHGLLIPPKNPGELAAAVRWAREHPREMNTMGRWAHKKALKRFHWERVADDYCRLFEHVLAGSPALASE